MCCTDTDRPITWCVCLLVCYISLSLCPTHTRSIVRWYDLSSAFPQTHTHTQRITVCHCVALHSLWHTDHIYNLITMSHFVCGKALFPRPLACSPPPQAPRCSVQWGFLLCFTSNHISGRLTKDINTAETMQLYLTDILYWFSFNGLSWTRSPAFSSLAVV